MSAANNVEDWLSTYGQNLVRSGDILISDRLGFSQHVKAGVIELWTLIPGHVELAQE